MMLVKASVSGDWIPNSCLKMEKIESSHKDVAGLYEKLGVEPTATATEIKAAAKRLMLENHPDVGGNEESFIEIREAYETLSNPASRLEYDNKEDGFEIKVKRVSVIKENDTPKPSAFFKDVRDILTDEEIAKVRVWQAMLLETAYEFGAALEIKAGIVSKIPSGYEKDIALIEKEEVPERWKAKLLILKGMIENGS